jgi:hypothetical protein
MSLGPVELLILFVPLAAIALGIYAIIRRRTH